MSDEQPTVHEVTVQDGIAVIDPTEKPAAPSDRFPYGDLPSSVRDDIQAYLEQGKRLPPPLRGIVSGELYFALSFDDYSPVVLLAVALWFRKNAPPGTFGDPARVVQFVQSGGLGGHEPGTKDLR